MTRRNSRWIWTIVATLCGVGFNFILGYPDPFDVEPPRIHALSDYRAIGDGVINATKTEFNFTYLEKGTSNYLKIDAKTRATIDEELLGRGFVKSKVGDKIWYENSSDYLSFYERAVAISPDGTVYCIAVRSKWPIIGFVALAFGSITYALLGRLTKPQTQKPPDPFGPGDQSKD